MSEQPSADIVHQATGMKFPPRVNQFVRVKLSRFDAAGRDISVGYNLYLPPVGKAVYASVVMTVYIFPTGGSGGPNAAQGDLFNTQFEKVKGEIVQAHPGAELIREGGAVLTQNGAPCEGRRAAYRFVVPSSFGPQLVRSDAYLFARGDWFLLYRVSYQSQREGFVDVDIRNFMETLSWPPSVR